MVAALEVQHLSYTYPNGKEALLDISFSIQEGEKVALVGANGAGKSTLLLHLNGIFQGEGQVVVKGMKVERENLGAVRGLVGMVFQNPDDQLFSPTVYDDVAYGPIYQGLERSVIKARVEQALAAVGMSGQAESSPYNLSGGEKKRVAIATVLSMQAEILVLDEPTAGLDPRGRRELIAFLEGLPKTLLIATHDLGLVGQLMPRTLLMSQGRLVTDGASGAILGDRALLEKHGMR